MSGAAGILSAVAWLAAGRPPQAAGSRGGGGGGGGGGGACGGRGGGGEQEGSGGDAAGHGMLLGTGAVERYVEPPENKTAGQVIERQGVRVAGVGRFPAGRSGGHRRPHPPRSASVGLTAIALLAGIHDASAATIASSAATRSSVARKST